MNIQPFPYKKEFITDVDELWDNSVNLNLSPLRVVDYPNINKNRPTDWRTIPKWLDWSFQGKLLAFVVSNDAYKKVDILTDYFTEEPRMQARKKGKISPLEYYTQNYNTIVEKANNMVMENSDLPLRYWMREVVYYSGLECSTFKISTSKALFQYLKSKVVLDGSSGHGDRILGAAAAGVLVYHGVDPNPMLRSSYDSIIDFLRSKGKENYHLITEDFLQVNFVPETYDTFFTSPPFWDYETYSDDPKQSISKREDLQTWISQFLLPYLRKAWSAIIKGGYMAIYISNTRDGKYVDRMYNFVNNELKGKYLGVVAVTHASLNKAFPIWIWRKV